MHYLVKRIENKEQIETCERFTISHYLWNSAEEPTAYGWFGYIEGVGFYAKMVCEESDPKRIFTSNQDPVYQDSAMEIFLAFPKNGEPISNDCMYINFEFNSNGAMLANYGEGRDGRKYISEEQYELANCTAYIEENRWYAEVIVPENLLQQICDLDGLRNGNTFYCNFYKIAETETDPHFGCFSPIGGPHKSFHQPIYFAPASIEK